MQIRSLAVQVISTCFSLGLLLALPTAAHADDFTLFNVNLQLANGGTVTGTLDLDETPQKELSSVENLSYVLNGSVKGTFTDLPFTGTFTQTSPYFTGIDFNSNDYNAANVGSLDLEITLPTLSMESFAGFTGGPVCSTSNVCQNYFTFDSELYGNYVSSPITYVSSGELTPVSVSATPEPSDLILLGTGVLGIAGAVRKRSMGA
jgi:hypothetical protein